MWIQSYRVGKTFITMGKKKSVLMNNGVKWRGLLITCFLIFCVELMFSVILFLIESSRQMFQMFSCSHSLNFWSFLYNHINKINKAMARVVG